MAKITIRYANRKTNCPTTMQVFSARSVYDASILAANFQSRHPELKEISCVIKR